MTKNSAHANCTHEATKSARAKCRRDASRVIAEREVAVDFETTLEELYAQPEDVQRAEYARLCKLLES